MPGRSSRRCDSAVGAINPNAPIFEVATVETLVGRSAAPRRLAAALGGGLAVVALVLALLGTFAVVACSVTERLRELGVRIALGATSGQVVGMILREALATAAAGCLAGLAGSLVVVRVLALMLAAASVIAAWWPARRAACAGSDRRAPDKRLASLAYNPVAAATRSCAPTVL